MLILIISGWVSLVVVWSLRGHLFGWRFTRFLLELEIWKKLRVVVFILRLMALGLNNSSRSSRWSMSCVFVKQRSDATALIRIFRLCRQETDFVKWYHDDSLNGSFYRKYKPTQRIKLIEWWDCRSLKYHSRPTLKSSTYRWCFSVFEGDYTLEEGNRVGES